MHLIPSEESVLTRKTLNIDRVLRCISRLLKRNFGLSDNPIGDFSVREEECFARFMQNVENDPAGLICLHRNVLIHITLRGRVGDSG
jgi:hypothetical protein